jgi:hypothetical protein
MVATIAGNPARFRARVWQWLQDFSMKEKHKESRNMVFAKLWCEHGCPEKMTIHVKSTGETITLIDGLPVTDNAEKNPSLMRFCKAQKPNLMVRQPVTDNRVCEACKNGFHSLREDAKYCSPRCRQKAKREQEAECQRREREHLLAAS